MTNIETLRASMPPLPSIPPAPCDACGICHTDTYADCLRDRYPRLISTINRLDRGLRRASLLLHRGSRFMCPFCGYHGRDLGAFGYDFPVLREREVVGAGRRNTLCRQCGSTDRERLILAYLEHSKILTPRSKVLHFAPETHLSEVLGKSELAEYVCADLFSAGYRYGPNVRNIDVREIPFPDDYFDCAICNHVLEHIPNDLDAMRSIYRVLKPWGHAILQVPMSMNSPRTIEDPSITSPRERELAFGQFDHVRLYGRDYPERLAGCGFEVQSVDIASKYPKFGLNPKELVTVAVKPES